MTSRAGRRNFPAAVPNRGVIMKKFLDFIDNVNIWIGRVFSFLILILVSTILYEVVARYFFNAPTRWSN